MRRAPKTRPDGSKDPGDSDGLSVYDSFRITQQECLEDTLSCHGLATLHVGRLRNIGLNIIRDPDDHRKLLITDMPFENPNDKQQEGLLESVARTARISLRQSWRRA
jgi:hypothetical protein